MQICIGILTRSTTYKCLQCCIPFNDWVKGWLDVYKPKGPRLLGMRCLSVFPSQGYQSCTAPSPPPPYMKYTNPWVPDCLAWDVCLFRFQGYQKYTGPPLHTWRKPLLPSLTPEKVTKILFVSLLLLLFLRINVDLAIFQPYLDLEAGDNQSPKFKKRGRESNPGPLAPQAKSLTTRPPLLPYLFRTNRCCKDMLLWDKRTEKANT